MSDHGRNDPTPGVGNDKRRAIIAGDTPLDRETEHPSRSQAEDQAAAHRARRVRQLQFDENALEVMLQFESTSGSFRGLLSRLLELVRKELVDMHG